MYWMKKKGNSEILIPEIVKLEGALVVSIQQKKGDEIKCTSYTRDGEIRRRTGNFRSVFTSKVINNIYLNMTIISYIKRK